MSDPVMLEMWKTSPQYFLGLSAMIFAVVAWIAWLIYKGCNGK